MIKAVDYEKVVKLAKEDAEVFLQRFLPSLDFFAQGTIESQEATISHLKLFVKTRTRCEVLPELDEVPVPNFASWLARTHDGQGAMYLFIKQMAIWQGINGMPQRVQRIRSIIHELGHLRLTPRLVQNAEPGKLSASATPEEEEIGWVYAVVFLGLAIGDYSLKSRAQSWVDDAPRLFL